LYFKMNIYWTEATQVYLIVQETFYRKIKSKNMIIRLLMKVYLFISQSSLDCIVLYVSKLELRLLN